MAKSEIRRSEGSAERALKDPAFVARTFARPVDGIEWSALERTLRKGQESDLLQSSFADLLTQHSFVIITLGKDVFRRSLRGNDRDTHLVTFATRRKGDFRRVVCLKTVACLLPRVGRCVIS